MTRAWVLASLLVGCGTTEPALDPGDRCTDRDLLICGTEPAELLGCSGFVYTLAHTCPGGSSCLAIDDHTAGCGTPTGHVLHGIRGGACATEGARVCDLDRTAVLGCTEGVWARAVRCAPRRCESTGTLDRPDAACEANTYSEGDRCEFPAGFAVCTPDATKVLACDGGTTVVDEDCAATSRRCGQTLCGDAPCIDCL